MRTRGDSLRRYALPLASGCATGLLYWAPRLWFLAFAALVPYFMFLERERHFGTRARGAVCTVAVMAALLVGTLWPSEMFFEWLKAAPAVRGAAGIVLLFLAIWISLPHALLLIGGLYLQRGRSPLAGAAFFPALWVLGEFGRAAISGGFTYGHLGYRAVEVLPLAITSRLWGVYGLSFLVVLINQLVARCIAKRISRDWYAAAVLVLVVFCGGWLWASVESQRGWQGPRVRAAVIQGGVAGTGAGFDAAHALPRGYDELIRTMRPEQDLIVLPSTVGAPISGAPNSGSRGSADRYFASLLEKTGSRTIIAGHRTVEFGRRYNSMIAWDRDGTYDVYRKRVLFPFGEYFPVLERMFPWWFPPEMRYSADPGDDGVVRTEAGKVGVLLCQEINMPALARASIKAGAELLASGGSEWQFRKYVHAEELRIARLRAAESSRFFLRAMKEGTSAIIDPAGRVVAILPDGKLSGALAAEIHLVRLQTPYAKFGDALPLALLAVVLAFPRMGETLWKSRLPRSKRDTLY